MDKALALVAVELIKRRLNSLTFTEMSFEKQAQVIQDDSEFISVCCSRRSGKSYAIALKAIKAASKIPGSLVPYIGLTRKACEKVMFPIFKEVNEKLNLGLYFIEHKLEVHLPNGSQIFLMGGDMTGLSERLRGPKYPIVMIDEVQSYKIDLENLVFDVLSPAVAEYKPRGFGQICLFGTPGKIPSGFFHDSQTEKLKFRRYGWTVFDNPHFPEPHKYLETLLSVKNVDINNPSIQREWFGRWVKDTESLVYKYAQTNTIRTYPEHYPQGHFILGVDLGHSPDPTAFTLLFYSQRSGESAFIRSYSKLGCGVTEVAEEIRRFVNQYPKLLVVGDLGAQGKMIGAEIRKRHQINIVASDKRGKTDFINLFNDDLRTGKIKILETECKELLDEWDELQWDSTTATKQEDDRFKNDCSDSALYAWRYAYHYIIKKDPNLSDEDEIEQMIEKQYKELEHGRRTSY